MLRIYKQAQAGQDLVEIWLYTFESAEQQTHMITAAHHLNCDLK
jgi:hypothetical protein